MAQKRKIDEDKENALTELAKKSKTSETNENEVKETDSNHPTTSASNNENPISNNPQVLATITNTEQSAVDDKTKEAQAELDREKEQNEKWAAYYKRASDREQNYKALGERLQKTATSKFSKFKTFSMSGEASDMPIFLGLHVKDFGVVSFPLADSQVNELIKLCKLSSCPQQAKKALNTRRGNTKSDEASYELDAEQIEIKNPVWNTKLKELVSRINREYGVQLEAKLHKVEINKPGGHFLKHRDSEDDRKIFGTLIIQPPSSYTGGELVVYEANGKSKKVIDFGQKENKSKYSVQFAAHYTDFEHELLEVKSGYRLALVYSLCWVTENGQLDNHTKSSSANELSTYLEKLNERPYPIGLLLEHHYTPQSFQNKGVLKVLKDADKDRLKALLEANEALEPEKQQAIYMCKITLEVKYKDENRYFNEVGYERPNYYNHFAPLNQHLFKWEEKSRSGGLSDWQNLEGKRVFDSFTGPYCDTLIDMKTGLEADLSPTANWGPPVSQSYDGYQEKEGITSTSTYNLNALFIWPKCFEFEILLKSDINLVIDSIYKSVVNEDNIKSTSEFETVLKRAAHIKNLTDEDQLNEKAINQMLEIAIKFNNLNYVKEFIGFQKPKFTSANSHKFVKLISQFGYEPLKDSLELIIQPNVDDLVKYCLFIMDLYNEKPTQSAAAIFAKKCLIDIINNPSNVEKISKKIGTNQYFKVSASWSYDYHDDIGDGNETEKQQLECVIVAIVKLLQLFADQTSEQTTESLAECMKRVFPDSVKWLLEKFGKEKIVIRRSPALLKILEARQRTLNEKIKERPKFTWRMPQSRLPSYEHPSVHEFLQSDREEMIYYPPFIGRCEGALEKFIKKYHGFWNNGRQFSCRITKDSDSSVLIKKTKRLFEHRIKEYKKCERELECIKTFIKDL